MSKNSNLSAVKYNIIFNGEILEGFDRAQVKTDLAHLFRKDLEQVERLFSDRPVMLKRNVDHQTAMKFQRALQKAGALCHLEPVRTGQSESEEQPVRQDIKTVPVLCPKCGYPLRPGEPCPQCILNASRATEPQSIMKKQWNSIVKREIKHWPVYFVSGLVLIVTIYLLFMPRGRMRPDRLTGRKLEFRPVAGPEEPVQIAWNFSDKHDYVYLFESFLENQDLPADGEGRTAGENLLGNSVVTGKLTVSSQADRTANIVLEDCEVNGAVNLYDENSTAPVAIGEKLPRRLYAGLQENGQLILPETALFHFLSLLFQMPERFLAEGMAITRDLGYWYTHSYYRKWMTGQARFTLSHFVEIDGLICARINMTALCKEDPQIPFADEYTISHSILSLYVDLKSHSVICGRLIISGETRLSDAGYGGNYPAGHKTREIITLIQKRYLRACP